MCIKLYMFKLAFSLTKFHLFLQMTMVFLCEYQYSMQLWESNYCISIFSNYIFIISYKWIFHDDRVFDFCIFILCNVFTCLSFLFFVFICLWILEHGKNFHYNIPYGRSQKKLSINLIQINSMMILIELNACINLSMFNLIKFHLL